MTKYYIAALHTQTVTFPLLSFLCEWRDQQRSSELLHARVWYSLWWTFSGFHDRTTQRTRSSSVQRLHEFKEIISHIKVYRKSHVTFPAITPLSRKDYTTVLPPKHYFILICIDQLHHRINKYFYNRTKYSFKLFVCFLGGKAKGVCASLRHFYYFWLWSFL